MLPERHRPRNIAAPLDSNVFPRLCLLLAQESFRQEVAAFGADLITGFPTESEEMFQRTVDLVDEAGLTSLHVFRFSPRPGTPAARMPQVAKHVAKERAARLRAKGDAAARQRQLSLVSSDQTLLVERRGNGRSECFTPISFDGDAPPASIIRCHVTGLAGNELKAELVS